MQQFVLMFLVFLSFVSSTDLLAGDRHQIAGIEIKELSIETEKAIFQDANTSFYLVDERASHFVNLNLDIDMGKYLYANQKVKSIVGDRQFRYIEYNIETGVRPLRGVDVYFRHLSGHALDTVFVQGDFPEDNAVGIRFTLIGN